MLASTIATVGRTTQYPSTGFLRFGVPWLLGARSSSPTAASAGPRPLLAAYALVGVPAVWSLETAFYTVVTFAPP